MQLELKRAPTATVAADDTGVFEGYGAVFSNVDAHGDVIAKGAFANSLARHAIDGTAPVLLWAHSQSQPAGRWLEMREDARGLRVKGKLNLDTPAGQNAYAHLRSGDVSGLSIGYRIVDSRKNADGTTDLLEVDLVEISIVAVPANAAARITNVKSATAEDEILQLAARIDRAAAAIGKAHT